MLIATTDGRATANRLKEEPMKHVKGPLGLALIIVVLALPLGALVVSAAQPAQQEANVGFA